MTHLATTLEILGKLIAFPTVSSSSNLQLIDYVRDYLASLCAHCHIQYDATGNKANLFATIGPECGGGVVLSGHSDVVPVAGQPWQHDPFCMQNISGKSYGRGSCDMKGFIAVVLATAPDFARLHKAGELARPVHFAFTYDEEVGCLGGQKLVQLLQQLPYTPAMVIVGEPTEMEVIHAHKGHCGYTTTFTGLAGHASLPQHGINAIHYAAQYIHKILELSQQLQKNSPHPSFYPPYSTLQVGRIEGGVALNVIADRCTVDWEMRPVDEEDRRLVQDALHSYAHQELLPQMRQVAPQANIETTSLSEVIGLQAVPDNKARAFVSQLCGAESSQAVSFATEAGLFQQIGIPTVVCGPGSIEQAHKADEFVSHAQLQAAIDLVKGLQQYLTRD